jgi:hypothetical protein
MSNVGNIKSSCRLCGKKEKLVNSHIFSNFMYKPMYKQGGQYVKLSTELEAPSKGQGGLREKLLCEDCEIKRSRWENYAKHFLFTDRKDKWKHLGENLYLVSDIDYKRLKLFVLSTLWLRSVIDKEVWAGKVELGRHQKIIAQMLMSEKPGGKNQYGVIMQKLKGENVDELILYRDGKERIDGHNCYRMVFGGYFWWIFVTSHKIKGISDQLLLREDGKAIVAEWDKMEVSWLVEAAKRFPLEKMFAGDFT